MLLGIPDMHVVCLYRILLSRMGAPMAPGRWCMHGCPVPPHRRIILYGSILPTEQQRSEAVPVLSAMVRVRISTSTVVTTKSKELPRSEAVTSAPHRIVRAMSRPGRAGEDGSGERSMVHRMTMLYDSTGTCPAVGSSNGPLPVRRAVSMSDERNPPYAMKEIGTSPYPGGHLFAFDGPASPGFRGVGLCSETV